MFLICGFDFNGIGVVHDAIQDGIGNRRLWEFDQWLDNLPIHLLNLTGGNMGLNETFAALSVPMRKDIIIQHRGGKLTAGEISSKFNVII